MSDKFIESPGAWRIRWDLICQYLPEGPEIGNAIQGILERLDRLESKIDQIEAQLNSLRPNDILTVRKGGEE